MGPLTPDAGILNLELYPPDRASPRTVTFAWRLLYGLDEAQERDWDWGHAMNAQLANGICDRLGVPSPF